MTGNLKILFFGTSEYAVPGIKALVDEGCHVPLVITQPDRPRGRGRRLSPTPVKVAAQELNIEVAQPESVRGQEFINDISALSADLMVVISYGRILPRAVLDVPRLGAVNIHPSLLPAYRGPSPIQWAVVNMEPVTGVTSIFMDEGMDSGDIILSETTPVDPGETAQVLHDRLAVVGATVLIKTVKLVAEGKARPVPQDHSRATLAPLLTKAHGRIDWQKSARQLVAFINGMTPWPGAFTCLDNKRYKILKAEHIPASETSSPGTVLKSFPGELRVATGEGVLSVLMIQGASGKALSIADFLRGSPIPEGSVFSNG